MANQFERELRGLRNSKNSIKAITKLALSTEASVVAESICQVLPHPDATSSDLPFQRALSEDVDGVPIVYALDSILKVAAFKG